MKRGRLGILVGGGPAPGINGVIAAATIEGINQGFEVIGFRDGFKWLAQGDAQHYTKLTIEDVKNIHLRGGSILGTARTNPAKSESSMHNLIDVLQKLDVTALVTIGGDDTGFSASHVYRRGPAARRTSTGISAAANIAWPEKPVKSSGAWPMPKPRKATLLTVVMLAATPVASSQARASGRPPGWRHSHTRASAMAGSRIWASPSRVIWLHHQVASTSRCGNVTGPGACSARPAPLPAGSRWSPSANWCAWS